jgi:hypothetical protein
VEDLFYELFFLLKVFFSFFEVHGENILGGLQKNIRIVEKKEMGTFFS